MSSQLTIRRRGRRIFDSRPEQLIQSMLTLDELVVIVVFRYFVNPPGIFVEVEFTHDSRSD